MSPDSIHLTVGVIVIVAALALQVFLVIWSRRTIERIARTRWRSGREIVRGLRRDRKARLPEEPAP